MPKAGACLAVLGLLLTACTHGEPAPATPATATAPASRPTAQDLGLRVELEPKALELLKAMSTRLAAARTMKFTAVATYESPARTGQPLAYFTRSDVTVQRPNQLRVLTPADGAPSDFYYDGKTMTAFSPASKLVAVAPAPPTIDAMLKAAYDQAAIYFPFADLIVSDPYADIADGLKVAFVVGQSKVVGDTTTDVIAVANDTVQGQLWDRRQGPPATAVPGDVLPRARQFPPCRRAVELEARRARRARHVHGGGHRRCGPDPVRQPRRQAHPGKQAMRRMLLGLAGLTLATLPFEPAHAWFRGGAMGSVSGGGGSWDATGYRGGSASGGDGSWSGTGFRGGTASGNDGSWSGSGYRGGTASGADGSWSGTGYRGGTASGGDGSWNANGADGGHASGGDGSWSGTRRYGNTAYGGYDHYNGGYYGGYHPPTVVNEYGSGCYNCGGWNTGGAVAAGAVGLAAGAAAGEATANAEASNAYAAGVAAGSAYTMNEVYSTLTPNCAYTPMGGGPYYNCAGTWFSPAYGANGALLPGRPDTLKDGRAGAQWTPAPRNCLSSGVCGLANTSPGGPISCTRPRCMKTTREQTSRAKRISWVTMSSVMPSCASSLTTASTSLTSSGSSAEVTSSQSKARGCIASARAMATRCCWPPDSSSGSASNLWPRPTRSSILRAMASASAVGVFFTTICDSITLRPAVKCGNRLNCWKIIPTLSRSAFRCASSGCNSAPATAIRPSSIISRPLMQRSSVLLPEPLLPMMAMTSPGSTSMSMPLRTSLSPKRFFTSVIEMSDIQLPLEHLAGL